MILHQLRNTSSRNNKEDILRAFGNNALVQKMFIYAYHPNKMYYQRFDDIDYDSIKDIREDTFSILDDIENRIHVGKAAREIIEQHSMYHGDLIKLICNKDLDCGITETTLNKVFGKNFVPEFKVQLAKEVPLSKVKFPCIGQIKYDGVRCLAFISAHGVIFKTRNGKIFEYPLLANILSKLGPVILDGELCAKEGMISDRTSVSGIVNSAIRGTPISSDKNIVFNVFDSLTWPEFDSTTCIRNYRERYLSAVKFLTEIESYNNPKLFDIAGYINLNCVENVETLFSDTISQGYEGLILKTWDHRYEFKRSSAWIKMKDIKTLDLVCRGYEEGTGKYSGQIGALLCVGRSDCGKNIEVYVGSGLTDEDRNKSISHYINKTIEVKYNTLIQDSKTGNWSLFLPRFVTIREDK